MPIYAFRCDDCETLFDLFVRSMSTSVEAVCPHCGSRHVEKEATAASALGGRSEAWSAPSSGCAPSG